MADHVFGVLESSVMYKMYKKITKLITKFNTDGVSIQGDIPFLCWRNQMVIADLLSKAYRVNYTKSHIIIQKMHIT